MRSNLFLLEEDAFVRERNCWRNFSKCVGGRIEKEFFFPRTPRVLIAPMVFVREHLESSSPRLLRRHHRLTFHCPHSNLPAKDRNC